jgi:hypothetical protein
MSYQWLYDVEFTVENDFRGRALTNSFHISVIGPMWGSNPQSQRWNTRKHACVLTSGSNYTSKSICHTGWFKNTMPMDICIID